GAERRRAERRIDDGGVRRLRTAPRTHQRTAADVTGRAVDALARSRTLEIALLRGQRRVTVHAPRLRPRCVLALEDRVRPRERVPARRPLVDDRGVAAGTAARVEELVGGAGARV